MTKHERLLTAKRRYRQRLAAQERYARDYRKDQQKAGATPRRLLTASDLMHLPPEKLLRVISRPDFEMTGVR
jgi:hypothetical protein